MALNGQRNCRTNSKLLNNVYGDERLKGEVSCSLKL